MVHTVVEGNVPADQPDERISQYLSRREELRVAEIELMRQRERVAEMRRIFPRAHLFRTINLRRVRVTSMQAMGPGAVFA